MGISVLILVLESDVGVARAEADVVATGGGVSTQGRVQVVADASCGDAARFETHLRQFLGLGPDDAPPLAGASIDVRIEAVPGGYALTLVGTLVDGTSLERRLTHPQRCDLLLEVAALVVAMAIDPDAALENAPSELLAESFATPSPEPEPTPALEPEPEPEPEPAPAEPAPDAARASYTALSVGLGVATGFAGTPSGALRAGVSHTRGHLRIGGGLAAFAPGRADVNGLSDASLALDTIGVSVDACFVASRGRFTAPLCARGEADLVHARPRDVPEPASARRPALRLGIAPSARWSLSDRFGLYAEAALALAALRPSFAVHNLGTVATMPVFTFDATIGLEARFP